MCSDTKVCGFSDEQFQVIVMKIWLETLISLIEKANEGFLLDTFYNLLIYYLDI